MPSFATFLLSAALLGVTEASSKPYYYYNNDTLSSSDDLGNGVTAFRWDGPAGTPSYGGDFALQALPMVRLEFPAPSSKNNNRPGQGLTAPASGESYYLRGDCHYVVISGNATFGASGDAAKVHGYGDLFWAMAGSLHGPIRNVGSDTLVVMVAGATWSPVIATAGPSDNNPSVNSGDLTARAYRRSDSERGFTPNPSPHSDECMTNGGVFNMNFDAVNNTPPVLRVKWFANCSIPFHYHPTGAVYFVQYGHMYFKGDRKDKDLAINAGEVRWVQPGFAYGPEYNDDQPMQITVLGTDTPPTFAAPPPGPYKLQKTIAASRIFDITSDDDL